MKSYSKNITKLHEEEAALKLNEAHGLPAEAKTQFVKAIQTMLWSWGGDAPAEAVWAFNDFMIFYKTMTGITIPNLDEDLSNWEEIEQKLNVGPIKDN